MDPTRLVEDNSPCNRDHVETDLNTWHFYINGYDAQCARRTSARRSRRTPIPGSRVQLRRRATPRPDAPLINSECGLVWGADGSAGDSDLAWQYRYMLNEYRLHDKLSGFVFTEFHDVVQPIQRLLPH